MKNFQSLIIGSTQAVGFFSNKIQPLVESTSTVQEITEQLKLLRHHEEWVKFSNNLPDILMPTLDEMSTIISNLKRCKEKFEIKSDYSVRKIYQYTMLFLIQTRYGAEFSVALRDPYFFQKICDLSNGWGTWSTLVSDNGKTTLMIQNDDTHWQDVEPRLALHLK